MSMTRLTFYGFLFLALTVAVISLTVKPRAQEADCITEQRLAFVAANQGMHDPTDIDAGTMTVRVFKHEDHFDVFLLHMGCVIGWNLDASQADVDNLVQELKGRPL